VGKRRGLGRGLGAIIPAAPSAGAEAGAQLLSLDVIHPNSEQPRQHFDALELEALADSIRTHGLLQPLLVAPAEDGYRLIAGERRLRAARLVGLSSVPVVIREEGERRDRLALSLVENVQREDLNPLEEAEAYRRLTEEFGYTQEQLAREVGKTRAHIGNTLRLLTVAPAVQGALLSGALSAGHARALAALPLERQEEGLRRVLRDQLTVRETEELARRLAAGAAPPSPARRQHERPRDPELAELEAHFRDALQTKVTLSRGKRGGRLVVEFYSNEELDALYRFIVHGLRRTT